MKLNARVLMHLALGTSSLAMLGCEPASPAPVQRPEPVVMGQGSQVETGSVQPDPAPESRPAAAARFAAPPVALPESAEAVAPEAVAPEAAEPEAPVVKRPRNAEHRDPCPPCGRG